MDPIFWEGQLPGAHLTPGISLGGSQARTRQAWPLSKSQPQACPLAGRGVGPGAHLSTHPGSSRPLKQSAWQKMGTFASTLKQTFLYFQTRDQLGILTLSPDPPPLHGARAASLHHLCDIMKQLRKLAT